MLTHCVGKRPQLYISVNNELLDIKSNDDLLSMFQCDQEICVCVSVYLFTLIGMCLPISPIYTFVVECKCKWNTNKHNIHDWRLRLTFYSHQLNMSSTFKWMLACCNNYTSKRHQWLCVCASHRASNSNDATQTLQYILSFKPLSLYNVLSLSPPAKRINWLLLLFVVGAIDHFLN